ncbi:meiosis-specific nuclear structural protein 1-like [Ischnura elegans]|uniref:meiosis-specific nuclear structural protein 1-like n=1 Tax=Ischnura elegans TaxID=197161 RepID=UPI001ED89057|nr:meiosis-specific nuclear structural protein 1-like [Ischnura elegans]XP_046395113.1 meiosis-specific nuclear structural protein 1-like [Ischnura elegans]
MEKNVNRVHGPLNSNEQILSTEYDKVLDSMIDEIDVVQDNVVKLREKCIEVIKDNYELSKNAKESLLCEVQDSKTKDKNLDPITLITKNLLQQLDLASQEKSLFLEFSQTVFQKMCVLEEKLASYVGDAGKEEHSKGVIEKLQAEYSNVIHILEARLKSLQAMLVKEKEKQEALMTLHAERAEGKFQTLQDRIDEAKVREEIAEKNEAAYLRDIAELKHFKHKATELLEAAHKKEELALLQIEEALKLSDAAVREKDAAVMQQEIAHEEVIQMKKAMADLIEDAGIRVKEEVDIVKQQFNLRIQKIVGEMELKEKESERLRQDCEDCKKRSKYLEKRLERLVDKGVKETSASGDTSPAAGLYEQQVRLLQQELSMEREGRKRLEGEMMLLTRRLGDITGQHHLLGASMPVKSEQETVRKHSVTKQLAQELREQITRLENISAADNKVFGSGNEIPAEVQKPKIVYLPSNMMKPSDLHEIIGAQLEMKQKWKKEANDLAFKLGKRIRELHGEVDKLKMENKELHARLKEK